MDALMTMAERYYVPELQEAAEFLAQPEYNFVIPLVYFALTMLGYLVMRSVEKPFVAPTWFKVVYNLGIQVPASVYCAVYGMPVVSQFVSHPFGVNLPMDSKALHYCVCIHFLSKFLDYVDTLLIVICKKDRQLSVLHVYHHLSISMVWGFLINTGYANGTVCFGAWINAVVHSIMYTYYGVTASKLIDTRPIKVWITRVQLTQFMMCIAHAVTAMFLEKLVPFNLCVLQFGYHCTMIALFGDFYYRSYAQKRAEKKAAKQKKGQ